MYKLKTLQHYSTYMHTFIYIRHYYSSLLSTHLPFFLAGWLVPTLPIRHSTILQIGVMDVAYMTALSWGNLKEGWREPA
jgi:hypothetical protein